MRFSVLFAAALPIFALVACVETPPTTAPVPPPSPALSKADPCTVPTKPSSTPEETAWRIFVAVNCDSGDASAPRAYQSWQEQYCLYHPTAPECSSGKRARQPGGSLKGPLADLNNKTLKDECSAMQSVNNNGSNPASKNFWPKNLNTAKGHVPKFCEEVFLNSGEMGYVTNPVKGKPKFNLLTRQAQGDFVRYMISHVKKRDGEPITKDNAIDFPTDAVELKVDWIRADALDKTSRFDCDNPPAALYTETVGGVCYGLASMHMSSKLYPNWLWATFEPQYDITNPNRCTKELYGECVDNWGAVKARMFRPSLGDGKYGPAPTTAVKPELAQLMKAAGLPKALRNYRLTGAQTDFVDQVVTQLGSSFTELNAGVAPRQASCITCHNGAAIDTNYPPPESGKGVPPSGPHVGKGPSDFGPNWTRVDFSWFLNFLPGPGKSKKN